MASAPGIFAAGAAISGANEFIQGQGVNWRIVIAGLAGYALFDGLEMIAPAPAVGLATVVFVTLMVTPFKGKSPAAEAASLFGTKQ